MKKAIVLLLALAFVGGAVFAQEAEYTLSGEASLIWGYDLNTEAHGFTNSADATLSFDLVAEGSDTHGEEPITGTITIDGFYMAADADDGWDMYAGDVTAKILFPSNLYLQIASAPGFAVNNAEMFALWTADGNWEAPEFNAPEIASAGGFTLGMDGDFSFALNIGSTNTHELAGATDDEWGWVDDDDDPTTVPVWQLIPGTPAEVAENKYMMGIDVSYALAELATFGANFIYGPFGATTPTMALGITAGLTPVEGLSIDLGADFEFIDDAAGYIDVSFGTTYEMAELFSAEFGAYMILDTEATSGNPWTNMKLGASLLAVEGLTFDVAMNMLDVLDASDLGLPIQLIFAVDTAYQVALSDETYVKPYASFAMMPAYEFGGATIQEAITTLKIGVEAALIPLTTFTLDFTAGSFNPNWDLTAMPWISGTTMGDGDKGIITFTTTIAY